MIHRRPHWHRPHWTEDETQRIGLIALDRCTHCGQTRTRIRPNPRPAEPRR